MKIQLFSRFFHVFLTYIFYHITAIYDIIVFNQTKETGGDFAMKKEKKTAAPASKAKKSLIASAATLAGVGAVYAFGALLKKKK